MLELLVSQHDLFEWSVIIYCLLGIFLFFLAIVFVAVLIWVVLTIKGLVTDVVNDSVKPTLKSIRESADSIKGTTDFMGDRAASPIIKTYGMVSGVRRGIGVFTGLTKRMRGQGGA